MTESDEDVPELEDLVDECHDLLARDRAGAAAAQEVGLPETIGSYRVLKLLGTGGMGEVFLAEQSETRQRVAVKVIKQGLTDYEVAARFAAEQQTLGMLNHEAIARVYEAGKTDEGRPYFAMEYVPGEMLTKFVREHRLDIEARLELFLAVCHGVEHAHQRSVLHRDLKPGNILVTGTRERPVAKIIDFGLAKILDPKHQASFQTEFGRVPGTLGYMSPEQRSSRPAIDTRADVYSLGVILYELLTGGLPGGGMAGIEALGEEPKRPSLRVARAGGAASDFALSCCCDSYRQLSKRLNGDLDAIAMLALEENPEDRYGSVRQLADDVRRYLANEPVAAAHKTRRYVLSKFVRRHRTGAAIGVGVAAVLLTSGVMISVYAAAASERLSEFNLFGLARGLRSLEKSEWQDPPPARSASVGELQSWAQEVEGVLGNMDRLEEYAEIQPAGIANERAPSDWLDGTKARDELTDAVRSTLELAEDMSSDTGSLTEVRRRIAWAQVVAARTVGGQQTALWERARRELAEDSRFSGIDLVPQVGLVPLGMDPKTRLQEFVYLLPGGEVPVRDDKGEYEIGPKTCPVFVLLSGQQDFQIGSQSEDREAPRYDRRRDVRDVEPGTRDIAPFFASKYEFTSGQWLLLTGENLAVMWSYESAPLELDHPVMAVLEDEIDHLLQAWALRLPEDGEWEYLARGGTDGPWWCGSEKETLQGLENLADASLLGVDTADDEYTVDWDDGWVTTAPVDSFEPNGFGLYHVLGNVCELCRATGRDGSSMIDARGGSWHQGWRRARIVSRFRWEGALRPTIGFRPVLSLQP